MDVSNEMIDNNRIAGTTVFLISTIGMVCNTYVVFFISRRPSMQNAFGKLNMHQGIADMLSSFLYLTYYAPMVFFDIKLLQDLSVTRWFGFVHVVLYDGGNYIHFFASINRLVVIFFPMSYGRQFDIKTAKILNCVAWALSIVPGIWAYQFACPLGYDAAGWHYDFANTEMCQMVAEYYAFGKSFITIALIVIFDIVTFTKSRFLRRELRNSLADCTVKSRKLDELNFVTQALLQGIVFATELITFFFLSSYFTNQWILFALTQVAYQSTQTLDGIIIICFNKEFRNKFRRSGNVSRNFSRSHHVISKKLPSNGEVNGVTVAN